jgi:YD repeat-containing protein
MLDLSGNARWLYDTRGRVTQETRVISDTGGGTFVTQWSYDAADRVVWQKYPGGANGEIGEQVNTSYTAQGLVKSVSGANVYVGDTLYNVRGQVYERRLGSTLGVVKQLYSYAATENFRLTALKSGVSPSYNTLQNVTYSYDDAGNVLTIADSAAYGGSQTQKFTYDYLDRLSTACTLNGANCATSDGSYGVYSQRSYQYNNAGNVTSFEGAAFAYNDAAHKHAVTHVGGVQRYWYDQDGNATRRIAPWGTDITLAYDAENRLTQVSNGVTASYVYDGDGNRVKAVVNSTTSVYVGAYYEVTGGVVKKYYYAGGMRVAENNGGVLYFLLTDHPSTALRTGSGFHCHDDRRQRQPRD